MLSWRISNSMEAVFCTDCLEDALRAHGKHEDVYLKGCATVGELLLGLTKYFSFYNLERPHQGLQNRTPDEVYQRACGGGAMILDK